MHHPEINNPLDRANDKTGGEWDIPKIAGTLSAWLIDREARIAVIKSELKELVKRNSSVTDYRERAMAILMTLE